MDYWERVPKRMYDSVDEFLEAEKNARILGLSARGSQNYSRFAFRRNDILCFGSESSGLPPQVVSWAESRGTLLTIPMVPGARCLNVASSAAIVLYEALRQWHEWTVPG